MTILTIVQKQCHFHLEGPQIACIKLFFYRAVAFWMEVSRNCPGKHYTLMSQTWWTVFLGKSRTSKASPKEHFRICRLHLRIVTDEGEKCWELGLFSLEKYLMGTCKVCATELAEPWQKENAGCSSDHIETNSPPSREYYLFLFTSFVFLTNTPTL